MRYLLSILLVVSFAQLSAQDLGAVVAGKFEQWQKTHQSFRTVLSFTQDKYAAADTAFFTAWFLTEDGRFVGGSQILHLDMVDFEGNVAQSILFRVRDGGGSNQIIINPGTRAGVYVMTAYNDAMKHSDPRYFFRKPIVVVNRNAIAARPKTEAATPKDEVCRINYSLDQENIRPVVSFLKRTPQTDGDLVLAVTGNGQLHYTAVFRRGRIDSIAMKLPRKDLAEGLNLMSVINRAGEVLATRHFYVPAASPVVASIRLLSDTSGVRQQQAAEVVLKDAAGNPLQGQFSITITNENFSQQDQMLREVNAVSELSDAFRSDNSARERFVSTQSPIVPWSNVLSGQGKVEYPPRLITMYGEVYFEDTTKPVPLATIVNCFLMKSRLSFEGGVDENGIVELVFLDFNGKDEMFFYAEHEGKELNNVRIRWINNEVKHAPAPASSEVGRVDGYSSFIEKKRSIDRSFNFFAAPARDTTALVVPLDAEFKNLGTIINLHDYMIFPTMSETIRELLPRLAHRKVNGKNVVKLNLSEINLKVLGDPLYIIDGVVTKNTDYFLSLVPDDLISIRIVFDSEELKRFMPVSRNGIVVVKTKKGVAGNNLKEILSPIDGLTQAISFSRPTTAEISRNQKPDFRSTIYWAPLVKTDAAGRHGFSFVTSDDTGRMRIKVKGLVNGQVFSVERDFFVRVN